MIVLAPTPLVAILRGVRPDEAEAIASVLVEAGFGAVEVPLNSPDPLVSIETIARTWGDRICVGAGTVLSPDEVDRVARAGAKLVVAPNTDGAVIARAFNLDLASLPGVATPTEAFRALGLGASGLKLFPAEAMPPEVVKAWRSVLPKANAALSCGRRLARAHRALSQGRRRRLRHRLGALQARSEAGGGRARGEGVCRGLEGGRVRSCRRPAPIAGSDEAQQTWGEPKWKSTSRRTRPAFR